MIIINREGLQRMRGAIFLNMGQKHNVHCAVAVSSLREHYDGPIALITEVAGPGRDACELIAADKRLAPIQVITDERLRPGSHGQSYFCKTLLPFISPFHVTVFFDADTLIVGDIGELWPDETSDEVVITQFADWVSTGSRMRQRILPWRTDEKTGDPIEPERVERMLSKPWPAINTGVMAWTKHSADFADDWFSTCKKRMQFIADETACQLIFPDHNCRVLDDRFNCSVVYPPKGLEVLTRTDVRVWHGHGNKFWKRDGSGNIRPGQKIYLPHYERFLESNMGNIRSIAPFPKAFSQLDKDVRERLGQYLTIKQAA